MAVHWVKNSWMSKVKKSTIQNCFRHVGFNIAEAEEQIQMPLVSLEEMEQAWSILRAGIQQRPDSKLFEFISPINEDEAFIKDSRQSSIEKISFTLYCFSLR
jgi:hypothetical protein